MTKSWNDEAIYMKMCHFTVINMHTFCTLRRKLAIILRAISKYQICMGAHIAPHSTRFGTHLTKFSLSASDIMPTLKTIKQI